MRRYRTTDGLPGIALDEWRSEPVADIALTDRDLRLAARLRELPRDACVVVEAINGGITVKTTGAVGLVRFSGFELRIDPKLPGDHLQLFRVLEIASGLDGLVQLAGAAHLQPHDANLLDFVIEMLAIASERIVLGGLRADYVEREAGLPALRGRLLPDRQLLDRFGMYDRITCRYDEHEHDIPDNQLVALALARGGRMATLPRVRRRARALAAFFADVCDPHELTAAELDPAAFAYGRHNEHYRPAHALSWMVLAQRGPHDELVTGHAELRSFLIDMNTLFERFVERVLRQAVDGEPVEVVAQRSDSIFWRADSGQRYAGVRPDILVRRTDDRTSRLPLDVKYKRYDARRVDVGDLTQAFLYAYAYRQPRSPATTPPAILVHPTASADGSGALTLQVRSVAERVVDAQLRVVPLHIPSMLDAIDAGEGDALDLLRAETLGWLPPAPARQDTGARSPEA